MFILVVFLVLLLISLISSGYKSEIFEMSVYMNRFKRINYTLGISHKTYHDEEDTIIEVITIGLILFDIEISFER